MGKRKPLSASIFNYPITKLPIYQILLSASARKTLLLNSLAWLLLANEDRILRGFRFTLDCQSSNRMVGRLGRQAGKLDAIGILLELHFFTAGQQPCRL